ncbi:MAG: hypothetical protein KatS3mg060_3584 [Dehalococcoidia bacterium]|jgi:hypothetical protein|nr:MAG: hypothetical protein KatS3mg060_3584 [Dehalococcoidia bacterium]
MSATMDRLAEANPNIGEHLRDWQIARTQNNEDAYDWNEFRQHELRIGAPDPGDEEPEEFRQYDWTKYAPSSEQKSQSGSDDHASGARASVSSWQGHTEEPEKARGSLWDFLRSRFGRR